MSHHSTIKVRGFHLDLYGHVNNARYLEFLEEARWAALDESQLNWFMQEGYALIVSRIEIQYHRPAKMGDELQIETRLEQVLPRSAHIQQQIRRMDNAKLVTTADVTIAITHPQHPGALRITGPLADRLQTLFIQEKSQ